MGKSDELIIPISKSVIFAKLAGMSIFMGIGIAMAVYADPKGQLVGWIWVLGIGGLMLSCIVKMFDRRPGLMVSEAGIFENSGLGSARLVAWGEAAYFSPSQSFRRKGIYIHKYRPHARKSDGEDGPTTRIRFIDYRNLDFNADLTELHEFMTHCLAYYTSQARQ